MSQIYVKRFGLAFGTTGALLYLACAFLMLIIGHDATIKFFNTLLHGLDVSSIIRMDMPVFDVLNGLIQTFVLAWLIGASVAAIYNISSTITFRTASSKSSSTEEDL